MLINQLQYLRSGRDQWQKTFPYAKLIKILLSDNYSTQPFTMCLWYAKLTPSASHPDVIHLVNATRPSRVYHALLLLCNMYW